MEVFSSNYGALREEITIVIDNIRNQIVFLPRCTDGADHVDKSQYVDEKSLFDLFDMIEYNSPVSKEHIVELIPVCIELYSNQLSTADGKKKMKSILENIYKNSKAKECGFQLENCIYEDFNWETKGLIVEGLVRAIRVMTSMKHRSKFVSRLLPTLTGRFRTCPTGLAVELLAESALKLAQFFSRSLDKLPDTEDLMPLTVARDTTKDFVFLLLERVGMEVTPYRKKIDFGRRGNIGAGSSVSDGIAYPRLRYLISSPNPALFKYRLCQLAKAASTFEHIINRPAVEVSHDQNKNNVEVTALSIATFVYMVECHGEEICHGNDGNMRGHMEGELLHQEGQVAEDVASQAADGGDAEAHNVNGTTQVSSASTSKSINMAFIPRIHNPMTRFVYLRDTCEVLLINNKVSAVFHLFEKHLVPMQKQLLEANLLKDPTKARKNFHEFLFPESLYREMLRCLSSADTAEQRGGSSFEDQQKQQITEMQKAVAMAQSGKGKGKGKVDGSEQSEQQLDEQSDYDIWAKKEFSNSTDFELPPLATSTTRTALWRVIETALRTSTIMYLDGLESGKDGNTDEKENDPGHHLSKLLHEHLALKTRFEDYYQLAMETFSDQDSHVSCVVASFKQDWWMVVQVLEKIFINEAMKKQFLEDPMASEELKHIQASMESMLNWVLTQTFSPEDVKDVGVGGVGGSKIGGKNVIRMPFGGGLRGSGAALPSVSSTTNGNYRRGGVSQSAKAIGLLRTMKETKEVGTEQEGQDGRGRKKKRNDSKNSSKNKSGQSVAVADASDSICYGLNLAQLSVSDRAKIALGRPLKDRNTAVKARLDKLVDKILLESQFSGNGGNCGGSDDHKHDHGDCCGPVSNAELAASEQIARRQRLERVSFLVDSVRQACKKVETESSSA